MVNYMMNKLRNDAEIAELKAEMYRITTNPQPYDAGRAREIEKEIEALEDENWALKASFLYKKTN